MLTFFAESKNSSTPRQGWRWFYVGLLGLMLSACEKSSSPPTTVESPTPPSTLISPEAIAAASAIWETAMVQIQTCSSQAQQLRRQIGLLLTTPSEQSLKEARMAWHRAHNDFQSLSVFFAIADSSPGLFGALSDHRYQLDGQPIQPGFIDYFDVYSQSGIVNDMAIPLSAEALRQQHGITDITDISIGFHAMEYLLWGEQGQRPQGDFIAVSQVNAEQAELGLRPVDLPNNRRRVYLQLLAELLVDDCVAFVQHWNDPTRDLRQNYQQLQADSRLKLWQTAVASLANELKIALEVQPNTPIADDVAESPAVDNNDAIDDDTVVDDTVEDAVDSEDLTPQTLHNQFALSQAQVINAKLRGLRLLLFGLNNHVPNNEVPNNVEPTEPGVVSSPVADATGLALWILPGLQGSTINSETTEAQSLNPLASLNQSFQQLATALDAETSWPLSKPNQQASMELLNTLQTLLETPAPSV